MIGTIRAPIDSEFGRLYLFSVRPDYFTLSNATHAIAATDNKIREYPA